MGLACRRIFLSFSLALMASEVHAGVFEIGAEGSFFRYNSSTDSYSQTYTIAGSIAYHIFSITAIEVSYARNVEYSVRKNLSAASGGVVDSMTTRNQFEVASVNIIQFLVGGKARFKPYVRIGGGYVHQKVKTTFALTNSTSETYGPIERNSVSGNAGLGVRFVLTDNFYMKLNGMVHATDLDTEDPLIHYTVTAGLAFAF